MDFNFLTDENATVETIRENMVTIQTEVATLEKENEELKETVKSKDSEINSLKETNIKMYTKLSTNENTENKEDKKEEIEDEEISLKDIFKED